MRVPSLLLLLLLAATACRVGDGATAPPPPGAGPDSQTSPTPSPIPAPPTTSTLPTTTRATTPPEPAGTRTTVTTSTTLPEGVTDPPEWLGSRPPSLDGEGNPVTVPTPSELRDRRFTTRDLLPPPSDDSFHSTIEPVPRRAAARSTWEEECPVDLEDLAYVTVTFMGFDQRPHTGEMLVAGSVAEDVVEVFRRLYTEEFPIEQMRIMSRDDLETRSLADFNTTTAFECRPVTGGSGWSEHAYGLAIDINPFHNPYVRGDTVLPALASAYLDRDRDLPGMIHEGDEVTRAFDAIGWGWGGRWSSLDDYQHFSLRGR